MDEQGNRIEKCKIVKCLEEKLKQKPYIKIVHYSSESIGVYSYNKLTKRTQEIAWIRHEGNKIVIVVDEKEKQLAKELGFENLHKSSFSSLSGHIPLLDNSNSQNSTVETHKIANTSEQQTLINH